MCYFAIACSQFIKRRIRFIDGVGFFLADYYNFTKSFKWLNEWNHTFFTVRWRYYEPLIFMHEGKISDVNLDWFKCLINPFKDATNKCPLNFYPLEGSKLLDVDFRSRYFKCFVILRDGATITITFNLLTKCHVKQFWSFKLCHLKQLKIVQHLKVSDILL